MVNITKERISEISIKVYPNNLTIFVSNDYENVFSFDINDWKMYSNDYLYKNIIRIINDTLGNVTYAKGLKSYLKDDIRSLIRL